MKSNGNIVKKEKQHSALLGCITIISGFVIASILFSICYKFIPVGNVTLYIVCYIISLRFLQFFTSKKIKKTQNIILFLLVASIIAIRYNKNNSPLTIKNNNQETSFIKTKYIAENNDSTIVYSHSRKWRDYSGNNYNGEFNIREKDYKSSNYFKKNININNTSIWTKLYSAINNEDIGKLDLILTEFYYIQKIHSLNQREFAEMVVSFVQDIPYALVLQGNCIPHKNQQQIIKEVLEECPDCCIGNQRFGIQTPVEFLANLKGDCDTRTVLIYTILKHFGYDIAVLNSDFYLHSIIGINIPSTGIYKKHKAKKYYFWETTNKYYKIGQIPNHLSNTNHWYVVLSSK